MMRLNFSQVAVAAMSIFVFQVSVADAQSGSTNIPAPVINAPQSFDAGNALPMLDSQSVPSSVVSDGFAGQTFDGGMVSGGVVSGSGCSSCGASGGAVVGGGAPVYSGGNYGNVNYYGSGGGYGGGCGGCQSLSIRTPHWSANACPCPLPCPGWNIGRNYGRPLIGRWCGY